MKIMKLRYIISLIFFAAITACTQNDGDIGVWFGTWRLEKITIDGTTDSDYDENVVLKFQNNVMESVAQYEHHVTNNCYAKWTREGDLLILELPENQDPDTQYGYVGELHLPWLPLIEMKVLNLSGKKAELEYETEFGQMIRYYLTKLY